MNNNSLELRPLGENEVALMIAGFVEEFFMQWSQNPDNWYGEINRRYNIDAWVQHLAVNSEAARALRQCYDCFDAGDAQHGNADYEPAGTIQMDNAPDSDAGGFYYNVLCNPPS